MFQSIDEAVRLGDPETRGAGDIEAAPATLSPSARYVTQERRVQLLGPSKLAGRTWDWDLQTQECLISPKMELMDFSADQTTSKAGARWREAILP